MKRYEGMFILDLAGKEYGLKEVVDKVSAEITAAGGQVEAVQKLERKQFVRLAASGHSAGHYVNIVFGAKTGAIADLNARFKLASEVIRVLFTEVPPAVVKA